MKKLLFGVILGLFAFVHSSPLTTVTQIPAKAEDEVLKEAATDGFLINPVSISNESPKLHTTAPVPELPSFFHSKMVFEGSGLGEPFNLDQQDEGEDHEDKTQSVSHAPTSTVSPIVADDANPEPYTTQISGESGDFVHQQEDEPNTNTTQSVSDGPSLTLISTESPKVTENSSSSITQSPGESFGHEGEHQETHAPSLNTTMVQGIMDNSGSESTGTNSSGESRDLFRQHEGEEIRTTTQSVSEAPGQDTTVFLRAVDHSISGSSDTQSSEDSSDLHPQPDGEHHEITTPSVSHAPSQNANVPLLGNDDSISYPASTPSQNNDLLNIPSFSTPSSETEKIPRRTVFILEPELGSGDDEMPGQDTDTPSSETSTTSATMAAPIGPIVPRLFGFETAEAPEEESNVLQPAGGNQQPHTDETSQKGHKTPGWMIIVGFIVGVAALIVLCVAIATRDKWNKPKKPSIFETQVSSTNQPREQEMETFLPRENGKSAEYTVIPLEELPDKYSSD